MPKIIVEPVEGGKVPKFANPTDACADCYLRYVFQAQSNNQATHVFAYNLLAIPPGETITVQLGFKMQLEEGWEGLIRGRSGLAQKGLQVHPGTIDHLYRLEVGAVLHNAGQRTIFLEAGERVCQLAIRRVDKVVFEVGEVEETAREGFGSTGR